MLGIDLDKIIYYNLNVMVRSISEVVTINAHAKVNLTLEITGVDERGYHLLNSIVTEVPNLYDVVTLKKREDKNVSVSYVNGERFDNDTARKMGELIIDRYDVNGVDIVIDKRIPIGAGLGGSSADAGAVARGMQELYSLPTIADDLMNAVGADVKYMYVGGDKVMKGQGEILEEITLPKLNVAILYQDGLEVSSRDAYKTYDRIGEEDVEKSDFLTKGECFNALEKSAVALCKGIRTNLDVMKYAGFDSYTITGSGSAVIGLCKSRLALADALAKARLLIGDSRKTLISFTK